MKYELNIQVGMLKSKLRGFTLNKNDLEVLKFLVTIEPEAVIKIIDLREKELEKIKEVVSESIR